MKKEAREPLVRIARRESMPLWKAWAIRLLGLLIAFVVAAILTPTPDVVNQLLMAGPLVLLYEVSIIAVGLFARRPLTGFPGKGEADSGAAPPADPPPRD